MADSKKKITDYIALQPSPQRQILKKVRKVARDTLPGLEEDFKLGVPWLGDKVYIVGLKDHVNVGFCIDKLKKDELALLEGKGKLMRHIEIRSMQELDEAKLVKLLKRVNTKSRKRLS